jgi:hypothetical protein
MPGFRFRTPLLLAMAALGGFWAPCLSPLRLVPLGLAQDLIGCQLTDAGQLQCVPGVSADPQSQINAMRQQISSDLQLEGAVQQQIQGLEQLTLAGEARQGQLIRANLAAAALAALPATAFHWYRLMPGERRWLLINGAQGPSYQLQPADVAAQVMLVVAIPSATSGSQRQVSSRLGPVLGVRAQP